MRALSLCLALLLPIPALAATKTETIPLLYAGASDMERMLLFSHVQGRRSVENARNLDDLGVYPGLIDPVTGSWFLPLGVGVGGGLGPSVNDKAAPGDPMVMRGLLPKGITALAVDGRRNSLSVTGEEEDIEALKNLIRLVDIPARKIRLSVELLELDAAAFKAAPFDVVPNDPAAADAVGVAVADGAAFDGLRAKAKRVLVKTELETANNRPLRLFWPESQTVRAGYSEVIPRVNGDGTITLFTPVAAQTGEDGKEIRRQLLAIRRISSGQSMVAGPVAPGVALIVRAELLPDADPGEAK